MGMYTQIYVKATFKENLSDNVVNIIKYMLKMDDIKLEDLDFFEDELQKYEFERVKLPKSNKVNKKSIFCNIYEKPLSNGIE